MFFFKAYIRLNEKKVWGTSGLLECLLKRQRVSTKAFFKAVETIQKKTNSIPALLVDYLSLRMYF